jgi:hypothetical protein
MTTRALAFLIVCGFLTPSAGVQSADAHTTIGVVLPQGPTLAGAQAAEALRQALIDDLKAQSLEAIPLSGSADALEADARAKQCGLVLYTHLERHGSSGLRGRLSALSGKMPFGAFTDNSAAGSLGARTAPGADDLAAVKRGDSMAMAYRLVPIGSSSPIQAESVDSAKASADGQDIMSPLLAQVAGAVAVTARAGAPASGAPATASTASTASSGPVPGPAPSRFGGLWGHRSAGAKQAPTGGTADSMDCAKLASIPNAPMSAEACEQLKGAQQSYSQAASDPSASRSGDEQMSCAQITAELKQQQYVVQDQTKVAAASVTVKQEQAINKKEYANMLKMQAENQAAVTAATAVDTASELATGGLVRPHALEVAERGIQARSKANNERVMREDLPVTQKMLGQTADLGADFAKQLGSNPRLARLIQLADAKHCKGGGT